MSGLAGIGLSPVLARNVPWLWPTVAQGYRPGSRNTAVFSFVEVRLRSFPSARAAERERRWLLHAPVQEFLGEFYPGNPVPQELPESLSSLPGDVIHYDVVAGVAAEESTMLMGAFRIDTLMWMIDGRSAELEVVVDVADLIAGEVLAEGADRFSTEAALRTLLPGAEDFLVDVELVDADEQLFRFGL